MGYWRCLRCDTLTGLPALHPACPEGGAATAWERCTCGSGGHPRECALHPDAYQQHIAELEEEDVPPRETPRPETIALVERLIAETGIDPARDHR